MQRSPDNLVAAWLWAPTGEILLRELKVRVGGSFVWPPPGVLPVVSRAVTILDRRSPDVHLPYGEVAG